MRKNVTKRRKRAANDPASRHREPRVEFYNRDLGRVVKLDVPMRIFSRGDRQHRPDERRELARIARPPDAAQAHRGAPAVGHPALGRRIAIELGTSSADRLAVAFDERAAPQRQLVARYALTDTRQRAPP